MTITNLGKIHVMRVSTRTPTQTLINDGIGVNTAGDPDVTNPPVTDAVFQPQVTKLQTILTGSKKSPPTYTTTQVKTQRGIVITSYNKIAANVEGVAEDVAIAAGDINAGITVVTRVGCKIGKKGSNKRTDFGITATGPGFVQVHVKKQKKGSEGHLFRVAIVTARGVLPAKATLLTFYSLACDIIIQDLPTAAIVAIQHANVVPVSHGKKTSVTPPLTGKKASPVPASKANHPVFSYANPDPYTWSDFIYGVAQ